MYLQGTCDSDLTCLYSAIAKPNMTIKRKKQTSPRGFKDAIGFGYVGAYFKGWLAKSIGLSVVLKHSEIF